MLIMWWAWICGACRQTFYRVSTQKYMQHNNDFVGYSMASAAPRPYVVNAPGGFYVGLISVLLGVCDAVASFMPRSVGDNYVLGIAAIVLSPSRKERIVSVVCFMYIVSVQESPGAYQLIRMGCMLCTVLACNANIPFRYACVRVISACICSAISIPSACSNMLRSITPSWVVIVLCCRFCTSPVYAFIIAALST